MITRPLLAAKCEVEKLIFPVLVTPKLDGIRALKINGKLVSRSFKEIPNKYIRETFDFLPEGIDGELMVKNATYFNEIQSAVMSRDGEPDDVYFAAFDYVEKAISRPYYKRVRDLKKWRLPLSPQQRKLVKGLYPIEVRDKAALFEAEEMFLSAGFEGIMLRDPEGPYKCGRSTTKQQILLKLKRFHDAEAVVIGYEERMHNANLLEGDEFGLAKRSHKKENLVGTGVLGALHVRMPDGNEFYLGSGFDSSTRKRIWNAKKSYMGKHVKYKYQELSKDGIPRFPVFLGFRELI